MKTAKITIEYEYELNEKTGYYKKDNTKIHDAKEMLQTDLNFIKSELNLFAEFFEMFDDVSEKIIKIEIIEYDEDHNIIESETIKNIG